MRIAPEGLPFVAIGFFIAFAFLAAALGLGGGWWVPFALSLPLALWVPYFFRNPDRNGPRGAHLVISPADGKIVSVEDVDEPAYVEGKCRRVAVFMNVFDVHVNRYPTSGRVTYRHYRPGRFFNATLDKASEHNEQTSLGLDGPPGRVLVKQIAGLVARRIVTDHQPGEVVEQGQRMGLIRFGSRVEVFLPLATDVTVSVGDRVAAGETVIGKWQK